MSLEVYFKYLFIRNISKNKNLFLSISDGAKKVVLNII